MRTVPAYAVRLLIAAKFVAQPPSNATAKSLDDSLADLLKAVSEFEEEMPVIDGVIQESLN